MQESASSRQLSLLPPTSLLRTGPVDHADWNYRPFIGTVQRVRFRLVCRLLGSKQFDRLLEIGYGSGVFMPELAKHASELYGLDPHPMPGEVEAVLLKHSINAKLVSGTAESLPYDDGFFDCVVSVSAIEYVENIDQACQELIRVLRPGGSIIIATPGVSPIWDLALRLSTGENPAQYSNRRQRLLPTLKQYFSVSQEIAVPSVGGSLFRLYTGVRLLRS